ncbi:MAG: PP2C family protein-serine/threonine phosphatase [bacterium]|nr:MAG: PP2C family protein-serine/threonine phosphatase [bacterium]
MNNIIEQLRLQSEAFQESFKLLSKAKNLEDLAHHFFQILRDNLQVENGLIAFKNKENSEWQQLFSGEKTNADYQHFLDSTDEFNIIPINDSVFNIAVKYPFADHSTFAILLGRKRDRTTFDEFDKIMLQFFLQQLNSAYQFYMARQKEKQLIFALNHRVLQLNSLIDTSIEISRLQETSQLLHLALQRVLALTNASKGMLRIKMGKKVLEKIYFPFPFKSKNLEQDKYKISASFRFLNKVYRFYLFEKESREGIVKFDGTDQLLLDAFTRQVHVALENDYLYEQSLEKERIDHEISIAGTIQKNLIPKALAQIEGYDQYGINIPTKFIGGDYYDCIPLPDGRFVFIMADVSGKGIAASLLVSTLHASAHAFLSGPFELESLVAKLNEVIFDAATIDKYITAVFSVLDPKKNELLTVNAGHNPTYILRRNKGVEQLTTGGIPLGMMRQSFPYKSSTCVLHPGDSVFYYTDGVTEAMNEGGEQYEDFKSIQELLVSQQSSTAKNFIDNLVADLNDFTGDTPQSDDITALYVMKNKI